MIKSQEVKDGKETTVMDSGHIITMPEQTKIVETPVKAVNPATMEDAEFRRIVLEKLGIKCI